MATTKKPAPKKSTTTKKTTTARKPAAKKPAAKSTAARKTPAKPKAKAPVKKTTAKKKVTKKGNEQSYEFKLTLLILFTVLSYLSLFTNYIGTVGRTIKDVYFGLFSLSAYMVPAVIFVMVIFSINHNLKKYRFRYITASLLMLLALCILVSLYGYSYLINDITAKEGMDLVYKNGLKTLGGGVVGNFVTIYMVKVLGQVGSYVVVFFMMLVVLILTTNLTMTSILKFLGLSAVKTKDAIVEVNKSIVSNFEQLPSNKETSDETKVNILRMMNKEHFEGEEKPAIEETTVVKTERKSPIKVTPAASKTPPKIEEATTSSSMDDFNIKIFDYSDQDVDPLKELKTSNPVINPDGTISKRPQDDVIARKPVEPVAAVSATQPVPSSEATPSTTKEVKEIKKENSKISAEEVNQVETMLEENKVKEFENYKIPKPDLLNKVKNISTEKDRKEIMIKARQLEDTLNNFGVDAKVVQISKGPTITRFELQPSPGVKVSKIVNLSDDIALNLAASQVRIVAPIPGKAAVGIEVPNKTTSMVSIREVVESKEYTKNDSMLKFALGKDISGQSIIADLSKMPHLLIAGATGSGKSVCVNTIITSILYNSKPDEVKFLMVDPKVVELNTYNGIPHLILPVVTDPKKASIALNWAVQEMTTRYQNFADTNARDISGYNKKVDASGVGERMPRIVVIIDELADLMMVAPNQVEDAICRLAQMARAAGIHLIVATQRPSVDVITGIIKANIPSRIAFSVSSMMDSRTILDMGGAEKLLGKGDMLYSPVGSNKPMRVQGSFISDEEVENVVDFVKNQVDKVEYDEEILDEATSAFNNPELEADELLPQVIEFILESRKASASLIQRRFRVGYNRAARLIDQLEERGMIGPSNGSKPREVLATRESMESV